MGTGQCSHYINIFRQISKFSGQSHIIIYLAMSFTQSTTVRLGCLGARRLCPTDYVLRQLGTRAKGNKKQFLKKNFFFEIKNLFQIADLNKKSFIKVFFLNTYFFS